MSEKARILAFAGSTRRESWNKKLIRVAVKGAEAVGAEVTLVDLADYPMPLYDGDLENEKGIPDNGVKFKRLMHAHDGFLISCPEYNSSISGVLKNTIDWTSRQAEGEKPLECFKGKVVSLMSASEQVAVPSASGAFADDGDLKDESRSKQIEDLGARLNAMILKIHR
jgi:NAD(P)H-dependent FMN reductase